MTFRTPLWTQGKLHDAGILRAIVRATLVSGVPISADLYVTPRAAGSNMSVDVANGIVVVSDYVCWSDAVTNLAIGAPPGSGSSRIDSIQARVTDVGDGTGAWTILVVAGTASASPSPPSVPTLSVELARVTVASGTTSIQAAQIVDRRPAAAQSSFRFTLPPSGVEGQIVARGSGNFSVRTGGGWVTHEAPSVWPKVLQNTAGSGLVKPAGLGQLIAATGLPQNVPVKLMAVMSTGVNARYNGQTTVASLNFKISGSTFTDINSSSVVGTASYGFNGAFVTWNTAVTVPASPDLAVQVMYGVSGADAVMGPVMLNVLAFPA